MRSLTDEWYGEKDRKKVLNIVLQGGTELKNAGGSAGIKPEEPLSAIIEQVNESFGTKLEQPDKSL